MKIKKFRKTNRVILYDPGSRDRFSSCGGKSRTMPRRGEHGYPLQLFKLEDSLSHCPFPNRTTRARLFFLSFSLSLSTELTTEFLRKLEPLARELFFSFFFSYPNCTNFVLQLIFYCITTKQFFC